MISLKSVGSDNSGECRPLDDENSEALDSLLSEISSSSSSIMEELEASTCTTKQRWITNLDYDKFDNQSHIDPSPVEIISVRNRSIYVKRDDLLRLEHSHISGNKARKMYSINNIPVDSFPKVLVSYGGPQSNAMLALAAIVHSKNTLLGTSNDSGDGGVFINNDRNDESGTQEKKKSHRFVYYTKKLPRFLRNQPNGNFYRALALGMELVELPSQEYQKMFGSETGGQPEAPPNLIPPALGNSLWIPQGGACKAAVLGGKMLAKEIVSFWRQHGQGKPLSVLIPGGTCSTALLVHHEIQNLIKNKIPEEHSLDIRVVVIPCVGDDAYARRQMISLDIETGGSGSINDLPDILVRDPLRNNEDHDKVPSYPGSNINGKGKEEEVRYFNFGEPNAYILETFREMKDKHGLFLDLLYGAPSWTLLLKHWRTIKMGTGGSCSSGDDNNTSSNSSNDTCHGQTYESLSPQLDGRELMYVHTGGLEGISSQLMRYKYKGLVESHEIQGVPRSRKRRIVRNEKEQLLE